MKQSAHLIGQWKRAETLWDWGDWILLEPDIGKSWKPMKLWTFSTVLRRRLARPDASGVRTFMLITSDGVHALDIQDVRPRYDSHSLSLFNHVFPSLSKSIKRNWNSGMMALLWAALRASLWYDFFCHLICASGHTVPFLESPCLVSVHYNSAEFWTTPASQKKRIMFKHRCGHGKQWSLRAHVGGNASIHSMCTLEDCPVWVSSTGVRTWLGVGCYRHGLTTLSYQSKQCMSPLEIERTHCRWFVHNNGPLGTLNMLHKHTGGAASSCKEPWMAEKFRSGQPSEYSACTLETWASIYYVRHF